MGRTLLTLFSRFRDLTYLPLNPESWKYCLSSRVEALHYWPQPDTPLMGGMLHFGTHCSLRGRPVSLLSSMLSTKDLFCLLVGCRDLGLGWSRWFVFIPDNNFSPSCHDAGAACLAHATQHQLLLSAGKKGLVRNRHAKAIWVKSYTHTLSTLTHATNICHFCYTYTFWPKNA